LLERNRSILIKRIVRELWSLRVNCRCDVVFSVRLPARDLALGRRRGGAQGGRRRGRRRQASTYNWWGRWWWWWWWWVCWHDSVSLAIHQLAYNGERELSCELCFVQRESVRTKLGQSRTSSKTKQAIHI